jgi:hypothetical protein
LLITCLSIDFGRLLGLVSRERIDAAGIQGFAQNLIDERMLLVDVCGEHKSDAGPDTIFDKAEGTIIDRAQGQDFGLLFDLIADFNFVSHGDGASLSVLGQLVVFVFDLGVHKVRFPRFRQGACELTRLHDRIARDGDCDFLIVLVGFQRHSQEPPLIAQHFDFAVGIVIFRFRDFHCCRGNDERRKKVPTPPFGRFKLGTRGLTGHQQQCAQQHECAGAGWELNRHESSPGRERKNAPRQTLTSVREGST